MSMHQDLILNKVGTILGATDDAYEQQLLDMCDGANRIYIAGAGRSKLVGNFLAMRLMHSGYDVSVVGEIVTPSIKDGDLLIIISGSGGTEQLVSFGKKAQSVGAKIVLICSKSSSKIGDLADATIQIGGDDMYAKTKGMPMGSMFELSTLVFVEGTISKLIHERDIVEADMQARHANME